VCPAHAEAELSEANAIPGGIDPWIVRVNEMTQALFSAISATEGEAVEMAGMMVAILALGNVAGHLIGNLSDRKDRRVVQGLLDTAVRDGIRLAARGAP
jgi:hypothetical protein